MEARVLFVFCYFVGISSFPAFHQSPGENQFDRRRNKFPEVQTLLKVQRSFRSTLRNNIRSEDDLNGKTSNRLQQLKCGTCILLVNYEFNKEKNFEGKHYTVEDMVRWVASKCELLGLESPRVCKGALETFGGEVAQVLKKVKLTAEEICGIAIPDSCVNYKAASDNYKTDWVIKLPPKPGIKSKTVGSFNSTLRVVHVSDAHIDTKYSIGSIANCNEPLCCHDDDVTGADIDEPLDPERPAEFNVRVAKQPAGKWGDYQFCDLPVWTFINMLKHIRTHKVDYVIWTGDIPAHDYLGLMPIYPAVGNHDSFPSNNFPPNGVETGGKYSVKWFYEALARAWTPWLDEEALKTVRMGGFYTTLVRPGHRIVSLNTNFCYNENWWIWMNPNDPSDMLEWFVGILAQAESNHEKVHVIGHVPPGLSPDCQECWSRNYYRILDRFQSTVTGQFFGHTHFDETIVYYDIKGNPSSVTYVGPSATPYAWLNPAYRIYEVESSDWSVSNHQTYVLDLQRANKYGAVEWILEYDARKAYGVDKLNLAAWDKLIREWIVYIRDTNRQKPASLENYISNFLRNKEATILRQMNELRCSNISECVKALVCRVAKNTNFKVCR